MVPNHQIVNFTHKYLLLRKGDYKNKEERYIGSIDMYWRDTYISAKIFLSMKAVGATILGDLWALEWAWHAGESNLRCVRSSGICMLYPNNLALIVSEISAFIRTDKQADRQTDGHS